MGDVKLHRATGYQPTDPATVSSTVDMLVQAERGEVTAFAWVAVGPDFARWMNWTRMTRQDRMNLIGQLQVLTSRLIEIERDS